MLGFNKGIAMNIVVNRRALRASALALAVGLVLVAGCKRDAADTAAPPADGSTAAQPANIETPTDVAAPVELRDVIENTPQAVVGISYPTDIARYPGLAKALSDYASAARGELQQAVDGLGNDKPTMPYELSLSFEKVLETPQLVVVSADGSRYTGGAHGEPLVARFVWLPEQQQMLTADKLVADSKGWKAVSDYIGDQLRERVATRLSRPGPAAGVAAQRQPHDCRRHRTQRREFQPVPAADRYRWQDQRGTFCVPAVPGRAVLGWHADRGCSGQRAGPARRHRLRGVVCPGLTDGGDVDAGLQRRVTLLLHEAGVTVGGDQPHDIHVHDPQFHTRVMAQGSLGLGESYMDGQWDAASLDGFLYHLMQAHLDERVHSWRDVADGLKARLFNLQAGSGSFEVGRRHYDLGNDLYEAMLGQRLVYSCGYWRDAQDLDGAQEAKLDLICRKLGLRPGQHVLDIGCGWGEALKFAAVRYGVSGVGITISQEQADYARQLCAGLPIEIRLQDYHDLNETFDAIFSVGMFEHVGDKNYRGYFEVARRCLHPPGLFLLHTIGGNLSRHRTDPWIARYIFPNSMLPSAAQVTAAFEGLFVLEDWHNFGTDYDRTLQAWRLNVENAWPQLDPQRYDERFKRMWRFYLAASMASFRCRHAQLWQLVLSPHGVPGGYVAPR